MIPFPKLFVKHIETLYGNTQTNQFSDTSHDFSSYLSQHSLVYICDDGKEKRKLCTFCKLNKLKTGLGSYIVTRHKCDQCSVPLCKGRGHGKPCFYLYHIAMFYNIDFLQVFEMYQSFIGASSQNAIGSSANYKLQYYGQE